MGYLVVAGSWTPWPLPLMLIIASWFLFTAGMILNDVFDLEVDARLRPERPLPSGAISVNVARRLGFFFLITGVVIAIISGFAAQKFGLTANRWTPGIVALLLAVMILIYDGWAKTTLFGPVAMGSCRTLNVMLGMSCVAAAPGHAGVWGFDAYGLWLAVAIGVYIAGITTFARKEAEGNSRGTLIFGTSVLATGLVILASVTLVQLADEPLKTRFASPWIWPLFVGFFALPILRRCFLAINDPRPAKIQAAVITCLFSIILIDAAICLLVSSTVGYALVVASLLLPGILIGRWINVT